MPGIGGAPMPAAGLLTWPAGYGARRRGGNALRYCHSERRVDGANDSGAIDGEDCGIRSVDNGQQFPALILRI